ncbi:MAG: nucleotidyl transferase AbiEii/AbiGii toxin family protein [Lachnospiraceae bacterium]|nr:nucleotidyl transferase AbiEii/AbiGii toxin family protein [Lachnospiraceae bacterium]
MISSSKQLKDKVRNISCGNSNKATMLIRNFMMERFLERVSISSYRDNFILKGGMLEATLDRVRQPIKIDISTDDVITPKAVEYDYKLMFEDRTISVLTYNRETLLAEKMQTIINRGLANTRLRDFYDIYSIMNFYGEQIDQQVLYEAFSATCEKRKTIFASNDIEEVLHMISSDLHMEELWVQFRKNNFYVGDLEWKIVIDYVENVMKSLS